YFLFSDWLGVQNLQDRSFALARWRLREALFGLGEPIPERLPRRLYLTMLAWAYGAWIWRFLLFMGIALLVYHAFFTVLGIFLMLVEIVWFIGRPLWKEMGEWWQRRERIRLNRNVWITLFCLGAGLWLLLTPWQSRVSLPATWESAEYTALYPPTKAQIREIHARPGDRLEAGQLLYVLESPDLQQEIELGQRELEMVQRLIQRQAASSETLEQLGVLESQLATGLANLRGLRERSERLRVVAPVTGRLTDVPKGLAPGLWVNESQMLGRLVNPDRARVRA